MNIKAKISVILLSVIFLLSSTGVFVIYHECESCEVSEVYINTDKHEQEKEHEYEKHHEHKSCYFNSVCDINIENKSDCCDDDTYYLIISEPYTFSFLQVKFNDVLYEINTFFSYKDQTQNIFSTIIQITKPPDLLSGKNLLHNLCILRL